MTECKTDDVAEKIAALWPVEGHDCGCDGLGRIQFKDGVVIHVPCVLPTEDD